MNIIILPYNKGLFRFRPDTTLSRDLNTYYIPDGIAGMNIVPAISFRISRAGKAVMVKFAERYLDTFSVGALLYPVFQDRLSPDVCFAENSLDYTSVIPAKAFRHEEYGPDFGSRIAFYRNGLELSGKIDIPETGQVYEKLSEISGYCTFRTGDLLVFELCPGIPLSAEDHITAYADNEKVMDFSIK